MFEKGYPKTFNVISSQKLKEKAYWLKRLSGDFQKSTIPYDFSTIKNKIEGDGVEFFISDDIFSRLMWISNGSDTRLFVILAAVLNVLINKYSYANEQDIIVGTSIYKQEKEGEFVNSVLALKNHVSTSMTFKELLLQVSRTLKEAVENQNYPFESLVYQLGMTNEDYGFPLFDILVLLENIHQREYIDHINTNMMFSFNRCDDYIKGQLEYNSSLYKKSTIKKVIDRFLFLLNETIFNTDILLSNVKMMSDQEKMECFRVSEFTDVDYPGEKTIQALFQDQVERTPGHTALIGNGGKTWGTNSRIQVSYGKLNQVSDSFAGLMRNQGVKEDTIVGIIADRSLEMVIGILAILKAGGGYLPIDPSYPEERIIHMLEDSQASFLLVTNNILEKLSFTSLKGIPLVKVCPSLTAKRPQVMDFDSLPLPDRTLIDFEKYSLYIGQGMVKNAITLQATRGCPYNCAYCHKIWPKKHVTRSAENIFSEVNLYYKLGVRRFVFIDDIFNFNSKNSRRFFELIIENDLDIQIFFPSGLRGDLLTRDYIDLMVRAGTINIALALETASERLQKLIRKNLNLHRLRENIEYICETYPNVIIELFFMHGFPTETEDEAMKTMNFVKSLKWIHFPYLHILKIYPNTDMEKLALESGISKEAIRRSEKNTFHQLSDFLPFEKSFTLKYQNDFLHNYFLQKERLLKVLPYQMEILTEDEIVQKYNSYIMGADFKSFKDLLEYLNIPGEELGTKGFAREDYDLASNLNQKLKEQFPPIKPAPNALRILLLDLSQYFSDENQMLYNVVDTPLGLINLMTYLNREYGEKIKGKIAKSRIDFDNFRELKRILSEFKPDLVGIRSLTCLRDFVHNTVALIRQWGFYAPIIAGGPYATSDYTTVLQDTNIDLVVIGEGEITLSQIIEKTIANNGRLPDQTVLKEIPGIAYIPNDQKRDKHLSRNMIILDEMEFSPPKDFEPGFNSLSKPGDLAYVIYTSGTTGKPKGAMIEHRNVTRLFNNSAFQFDFNDKDVWTMFHSYCFDFSVWEMYGALLFGGKLILIPEMAARDSQAYLEIMREESVTILNQTPTSFNNISSIEMANPRQDLRLRYIIFGGERLNPEKLKDWKLKYPETKLINMYGITETTVHVTYKEITDDDIKANISNVGKPIPTLDTYILDKNLNILPDGIPGELSIGGEGLARGYLNRNCLTGEKFAGHPFKKRERIYRSGDLAKRLENGDMEYLGRFDQQVKIRGYRIELQEIESRLNTHPSIKKSVVLEKRDQAGLNSLIAYYISDEPIDTSTLREYLAGVLPDHMIPAFFIPVDHIPLTPNGKIDKKSLLEREIVFDSEYAAPTNKIEKELTSIWEDVLGVSQVGTRDNYFQLGGDSIKMIRLINSINKNLNTSLNITDVFNNQTIDELANIIDEGVDPESDKYLEEVRAELDRLRGRVFSVGRWLNELEDVFPMSDIQKGMVFYYLKNPGQAVYHDQMVFYVNYGEFDIERFRKAMNLLMHKHYMLRTAFNLDDFGQEIQMVYKKALGDIQYHDISDYGKAAQEVYVQRLVNLDRHTAFDVEQPPLWRMSIFKVDHQSICLFWSVHHAIIDGWSNACFMTELNDTYIRLKSEPGFVPQKLKSSYKDFIIAGISEKKRGMAMDFWKNELHDCKRIEFPLKKNNEPSPGVRRFNHKFEPTFFNKLKKMSNKHNVSVKNICFCSYLFMLNMLSFDNDIVVGLVSNNRPLVEDGDKIIGCFLNSIPFRMKIPSNITWLDYIHLVEDKMVELKPYERVPFFKILRMINEKAQEENPLFDTIFNFVDFYVYKRVNEEIIKNYLSNEPDLPFSIEGFENTNTVLDFNISTTLENFHLTIFYSSLLSDEFVENLFSWFKTIILKMVNHPQGCAKKEEIIDVEERKKLLGRMTQETGTFPLEKPVVRLFEEEVEKNPDHMAVVFKDIQLSYRELNSKSHGLAELLKRKGIEKDRLVTVMMARSHWMVISILAIWKPGGAYVPIDPDYPQKRIESILEVSEPGILLTDTDSLPARLKKGKKWGEKIVVLDQVSLPGKDSNQVSSEVEMSDLAYVIFTSGSTGKPKGAMVEHGGIANHIWAKIGDTGMKKGSIMAQNASFTFVVSVWQFFAPLVLGGKIVIYSQGTIMEPQKFVKQLKKDGVSILEVVPSYLSTMLESDMLEPSARLSLKCLVVTGEALKPELVRRWFEVYPGIKMINAYGATETSDDISHFPISQASEYESIIIGKSLPNLDIYILDNTMQLCPLGVKGEICVSGVGVGRGYLKNKNQTKQVFLEDPLNPKEGRRLYKTGDMGRILPDGNIEYCGRMDNQVKIRGFRVELGEIESEILNHPKIKDAVVMLKTDEKGQKNLYTYIVTSETSNQEFKAHNYRALKRYLSYRLPGYMIPNQVIELERLPLNPHGKVDRKSLPDPGNESTPDLVKPQTPIQVKLTETWSDLLEISREAIGIHSDFFELGGHSLSVMRLTAKIHKELKVNVPPGEVFKNPTIFELSHLIENSEKEEYIELIPMEKREYYELSSNQKSLYVLHRMDSNNTAYNMPSRLDLPLDLDMEQLRKTCQQLIARHESLRTSFITVGRKPVQRIQKDSELQIEQYSLEPNSDIKKQKQKIMEAFIRPFDLTRAPLLRIGLIKTQDQSILLLDMHHIISDGISLRILQEEFDALLKGHVIPALKLHYKDFSQFQSSALRAEKFWLKELKGELPVIQLPYDFPRPSTYDFAGSSMNFKLGTKEIYALKNIAREEKVTTYLVMLAIYNILLYKISGQQDIIVGTNVAGRNHPDLQGIIGMMVNTLVLRQFPQKEKTFIEFLHKVKERTLKAFDNQDYSFNDLVETLLEKRDANRNPIFDVLFSFFEVGEKGEKKRGSEPGIFTRENKISKFDLTLECIDMGDSMELLFEYSTALFKPKTIKKMISYFLEITSSVIKNPGARIWELEMVSEQEEHRVLERVLKEGEEAKENLPAEFGF